MALNRLTKEETPLTFFTLLACYFYCRAQQSDAGQTARRWYDLSAISFGLALASQYILHLIGLNALAWLFAGKMGLNRQPSQFNYKRFFLVMLLALIVVNPVILSPANFHAIVQWLHHDGVKHSGYDFDGRLYMNFISRLFAGVPWFYYLWLVVVKTPIPILVAVMAGSALLLRDRRTLASCFFLSLGVVQLAGLSLSGAKWIRYSLPLLPFLYLAGGYAVQQTLKAAKGKVLAPALVGPVAVILLGWPLLQLQSWAPYYSFYLNSIGGGKQNIARYFAMDEVSEFDTREVAKRVCPFAPAAATVATARPASMGYYLESCGRADLHIVPLYDMHYAPQEGDLIVLEPSRRFFETQRFFDAFGNSKMPHSDVRVGPVLASTIYLFDRSVPITKSGKEEFTLTQLQGAPTGFKKGYSRNRSDKYEQVRIGRPNQEVHTMTPLYRTSEYDRALASRALLILGLSIIGLPAFAQQANVSATLTADEIIGRVVEMNAARAKALEGYSSVRTYHLECHCMSHKVADMVVRTDYHGRIKRVHYRVRKRFWHGAGSCVQETPGGRTGVNAG